MFPVYAVSRGTGIEHCYTPSTGKATKGKQAHTRRPRVRNLRREGFLTGPDARKACGQTLVSGCTCHPPAQRFSDLCAQKSPGIFLKCRFGHRRSGVGGRASAIWAGGGGALWEERTHASRLVRNVVGRLNWEISLSLSKGRRFC